MSIKGYDTYCYGLLLPIGDPDPDLKHVVEMSAAEIATRDTIIDQEYTIAPSINRDLPTIKYSVKKLLKFFVDHELGVIFSKDSIFLNGGGAVNIKDNSFAYADSDYICRFNRLEYAKLVEAFSKNVNPFDVIEYQIQSLLVLFIYRQICETPGRLHLLDHFSNFRAGKADAYSYVHELLTDNYLKVNLICDSETGLPTSFQIKTKEYQINFPLDFELKGDSSITSFFASVFGKTIACRSQQDIQDLATKTTEVYDFKRKGLFLRLALFQTKGIQIRKSDEIFAIASANLFNEFNRKQAGNSKMSFVDAVIRHRERHYPKSKVGSLCDFFNQWSNISDFRDPERKQYLSELPFAYAEILPVASYIKAKPIPFSEAVVNLIQGILFHSYLHDNRSITVRQYKDLNGKNRLQMSIYDGRWTYSIFIKKDVLGLVESCIDAANTIHSKIVGDKESQRELSKVFQSLNCTDLTFTRDGQIRIYTDFVNVFCDPLIDRVLKTNISKLLEKVKGVLSEAFLRPIIWNRKLATCIKQLQKNNLQDRVARLLQYCERNEELSSKDISEMTALIKEDKIDLNGYLQNTLLIVLYSYFERLLNKPHPEGLFFGQSLFIVILKNSQMKPKDIEGGLNYLLTLFLLLEKSSKDPAFLKASIDFIAAFSDLKDKPKQFEEVSDKLLKGLLGSSQFFLNELSDISQVEKVYLCLRKIAKTGLEAPLIPILGKMLDALFKHDPEVDIAKRNKRRELRLEISIQAVLLLQADAKNQHSDEIAGYLTREIYSIISASDSESLKPILVQFQTVFRMLLEPQGRIGHDALKVQNEKDVKESGEGSLHIFCRHALHFDADIAEKVFLLLQKMNSPNTKKCALYIIKHYIHQEVNESESQQKAYELYKTYIVPNLENGLDNPIIAQLQFLSMLELLRYIFYNSLKLANEKEITEFCLNFVTTLKMSGEALTYLKDISEEDIKKVKDQIGEFLIHACHSASIAPHTIKMATFLYKYGLISDADIKVYKENTCKIKKNWPIKTSMDLIKELFESPMNKEWDSNCSSACSGIFYLMSENSEPKYVESFFHYLISKNFFQQMVIFDQIVVFISIFKFSKQRILKDFPMTFPNEMAVRKGLLYEFASELMKVNELQFSKVIKALFDKTGSVDPVLYNFYVKSVINHPFDYAIFEELFAAIPRMVKNSEQISISKTSEMTPDASEQMFSQLAISFINLFNYALTFFSRSKPPHERPYPIDRLKPWVEHASTLIAKYKPDYLLKFNTRLFNFYIHDSSPESLILAAKLVLSAKLEEPGKAAIQLLKVYYQLDEAVCTPEFNTVIISAVETALKNESITKDSEARKELQELFLVFGARKHLQHALTSLKVLECYLNVMANEVKKRIQGISKKGVLAKVTVASKEINTKMIALLSRDLFYHNYGDGIPKLEELVTKFADPAEWVRYNQIYFDYLVKLTKSSLQIFDDSKLIQMLSTMAPIYVNKFPVQFKDIFADLYKNYTVKMGQCKEIDLKNAMNLVETLDQIKEIDPILKHSKFLLNAMVLEKFFRRYNLEDTGEVYKRFDAFISVANFFSVVPEAGMTKKIAEDLIHESILRMFDRTILEVSRSGKLSQDTAKRISTTFKALQQYPKFSFAHFRIMIMQVRAALLYQQSLAKESSEKLKEVLANQEDSVSTEDITNLEGYRENEFLSIAHPLPIFINQFSESDRKQFLSPEIEKALMDLSIRIIIDFYMSVSSSKSPPKESIEKFYKSLLVIFEKIFSQRHYEEFRKALDSYHNHFMKKQSEVKVNPTAAANAAKK